MKKEKDNLEEKDNSFITISIIVSVVIIGLWICNYFALINLPATERGTIGDMFGVINSLFSGLALAGIILTILLQRKELKYQREELRDTRKEFQVQNETLKIQRFENTFFHLLDQLHQIVNAIDFTYHTKKKKEQPKSFTQMFAKPDSPLEDLESITITGRDVFRYKFNKLNESIRKNEGDFKEIYLVHYGQAKADFGHYFRTLYRILKIIDETDFFYDGSTDEKEIFQIKYRYASILRAQISDYELGWIFYNCLSVNGIDRFKPLIEKYSFFNNLPDELVAISKHLDFYNNSAYGN